MGEVKEHDEEAVESGSEVVVGIGEDEESPKVEIPGELPVLPLKNTVLFPFLLHQPTPLFLELAFKVLGIGDIRFLLSARE